MIPCGAGKVAARVEPMEDEKEKKRSVKVVDRRSFTADGRPRHAEAAGEEPAEGPAEAAVPEPATRPSATGAREPKTGGDAKAHRGPGFTMESPPQGAGSVPEQDPAFINLCISLYQSGCIHLGLTGEDDAEGRRGKIDIDAARATIEMLGMIRRKTAGNLSKEESHILEGLLAELQMAYVASTKGPGT